MTRDEALEGPMTDPMTVGDKPAAERTPAELQGAAVTAMATAMATRWPGVDVDKLRGCAESLVALGMEIGDSGAVVLIPDNRPDSWRLADAVRRTGGDYDGQPTGQDLQAADAVIQYLLDQVVDR